MHECTFHPAVHVQGHFGIIYCTCLKLACNMNTGHRAQWTEIWDSGTPTRHIWDTFHFGLSKIILESFGALVIKWPVACRRLAIVRKLVKFGTQLQGE